MQKRLLTIVTCVLMLATATFAADKKPAAKKSAGGPDKAYLQKIWDGWAGLDGTKQAQYYAPGPHLFFDLAPLKYSSWDEYQTGVAKILGEYQSGTLTINDDAEIHTVGDTAWVAATVKSDLVKKGGKREMATFRWTAIFEKHDGKWLIVHEHVSEPMS
jgi:ketosteroid isomerase-like protein